MLSFLLLLSSSGLTYAQHFCGDHKMMSMITLGETQLSCGMAAPVSMCDDEIMEEMHCCNNEYTFVDTDDNFAKAAFDLDVSPVFVVAFCSLFLLPEVENYKQNENYFKDYSPPPLGEDLQVLYETFLI